MKLLTALAAAYIGWRLGERAYRELGIHAIELFANSAEEET